MEKKIVDEKKVDINRIIAAYDFCLRRLIEDKKFIVRDFIAFMEQNFSAAGYRTPPKVGEQQNILIIHDAGIGDFVLHSGAIREIRRLYPTAHITLVVNSGSVPLAESCPYIDKIVTFENGQPDFAKMFQSMIRMATKILTRRIDICFAFVHRAWTPFLVYMSGARIRIAHNVKEIDDAYLFSRKNPLLQSLDFFATDFVPMFINGSHMVDANFSPLDTLMKIPVANRELEVWYTPLDLAVAKEFLKTARQPIYALSMGGIEFMKHYPPELYAELLKMILAEESTATFVIVGGGKADLNSAQILRKTLGEEIFSTNIIDLTNRITFRQTAAILSLCDMYIGNDTGAMHIAAACKCPVLEPNCFAADLPKNNLDYVRLFSPYRVPSVVVQPKTALDGCKVTEPYDSMGCRVNKPHCITQIAPQTLFNGYKLLKERIEREIITPLYVSL